MEKCIEINKVYPNGNKQCKKCKLDNCKEAMKLMEDTQKYEDNYKVNIIEKMLPERCKICFGNNFITITNLDIENGKVHCPNLLPNGECILQAHMNVQKEKEIRK